ncbi:autotransporter [Conexibacter sp. JD483]|uniref:autotransporter n=1 Tax=unclassified Conexibacter TaxID=2627773 RepID=UPI0027187D9F|nr:MULTISPECIES: autotransporter [unclassified Conexibacter]MDO8185547.1 autotransporter [Conexibacter sp. CPCC 205706]MDO8197266.1 autotransporter [Conexibacter sp. CPCC 205762]MDR9371547.1 autotransporter [Conexibacter sp. JD483]
MRGVRLTACAAVVLALLWSAGVATARTVNIDEAVKLHLVRKSGNTLYEAGSATGTLPGNVSAVFQISVTSVSGTVTIYPRGGSLTISVAGTPRSAGMRARFGGTMRVVRGSGKFRGASGSGTFSGVVNRRTWDVKVDADARLTY